MIARVSIFLIALMLYGCSSLVDYESARGECFMDRYGFVNIHKQIELCEPPLDGLEGSSSHCFRIGIRPNGCYLDYGISASRAEHILERVRACSKTGKCVPILEIAEDAVASQIAEVCDLLMKEGVYTGMFFSSGKTADSDARVSDVAHSGFMPINLPNCPMIDFSAHKDQVIRMELLYDGQIQICGKQKTLEELETLFKERRKKTVNNVLFLLPDSQLQYRSIRNVLDAATRNGIWYLFLASTDNCSPDRCHVYPINLPCP